MSVVVALWPRSVLQVAVSWLRDTVVVPKPGDAFCDAQHHPAQRGTLGVLAAEAQELSLVFP